MKKIQPIRGTRDIMENEFLVYLNILNVFRNLTSNYGFREISTPIIEDSEVFKKTLGLTSDIIKKETYTFKDRSDNEITLRPEGTASIVRCFINNKLHQTLPQKITYSGPMFRYDRPQQGRFRQFHQLGAEIIGTKDISSDLELIYMARDFLNRIDLPENFFKIHVNNLGDKESRQKYSKELQNFFQDHRKKLTPESLDRLNKNPLRILDTKNKEEQKLLKKTPKLKNFLSNESLDIFDQFKEGSKKLQIPIVVNDNLVRGLDYYNHICYEFVSDRLGSKDSFLAGGRYDGLIKDMGGPDYPGCGFAAGIERIILICGSVIPILPEKYLMIIALDKENKIKAMKITNQIRKVIDDELSKKNSTSFSVDLIFKNNLSKGLKYASEKKATHAVIIGEKEISQENIIIKDLKKRTQKKIQLLDLSVGLRNYLFNVKK